MEVLAYAVDGSTLLGVIPQVMEASGMEELEGKGGGSVTVPIEIAKTYSDWLTERNVVKIRVANRIVAAWVIRKRENVLVDGSGVQSVQFSGPGLLSWLDDAVVHHEFENPYSAKTRWFNWGAMKTGSSDWVPPTKVRKRGSPDFTDDTNPFKKKPANWPDMGDTKPWWVWDRKSDVTVPAGWVYLRKTFEIANDGTLLTLYITANNWCYAILDGEPLVTAKERRAYKRTYEIDFELDAGTHVLGIAARNKGKFAGVIAAILEFEDDDDETGVPVIWTGETGWKCKGYPAEVPGWTAGKVLRELLEEATARGVSSVGRLSPGFSSGSDTGSLAWEEYGFSYDVGMTYWEVVEDLLDYGVHVAVAPDSLTFNAWYERGTDRRSSVFLDIAAHLTEASDSKEAAVVNSLLVETKDDWKHRNDSSSIAEWGRIEGYVDLSQLSDKRADRVAGAVLKRAQIATEGVTASYVPTTGNVPWVDFGVGDYLSVSRPNGGYKARKVISISVAMDSATGVPVYTVELDAISKDRLDRLQRIIDATGLATGTLAGRSPKKGRGKSPKDGEDPGDHRKPKPPGPIDDIGVDDPGFDDLEGEFDVGEVSMPMGNEMLDAWKQFGDLRLALLKDEPVPQAGVWLTIEDHEITGSGYARGEIETSILSAASGHDPVVVKTNADVSCGTNDGDDDWESIAGAAVVTSDSTVLAVTMFALPVTIAAGKTATFLAGDVQFVVDTV